MILLDCIVTAVILACIKKLIKIGEFLCSHLILKMEENIQRFQCMMLYYLKKGKNTSETKKKCCAVYGEVL